MTWGEQVDAGGHATETGRSPQPWCRYAASCYKSGTPLHRCHPRYGKPYTDGCPRCEDMCPSALLASGRMTYKALPEDLLAMARMGDLAVCRRCGGWFERHHHREAYCSDACRRDAKRERAREWQHRHPERCSEYNRRYKERKGKR